MAQVKIIAPQTREAEHLRVAAYCRVSSDSKDQLHSYAAQIRNYTEAIARHDGWELVDVYADEGLTGTRMDQRDDFNRMMRDCRKGKIDRILVKSVSRFARNTRDCLSALRELSAMGVSVRFEKENIDTKTLTTELMVSVSGSLAQQESISISANQKMSYQRRMERGEFITCTAPYGYRIVNKKDLEIAPEEAATVRWIFDAYLKGRSSGWIAEQLTAKGIPSQSGAECWRETGVRYLLTNEKYIGDALSQKSYSCGFPFVQKRNHGERLQYYTENSHPAIIDRDTFERVQALLQKKAQKEKKRREKSPLALKIVCGNCGTVFQRRSSQSGYVTWVCRTHDRHAADCPVGRIPEAEIHAAFLRMYHRLKSNADIILAPALRQLNTLDTILRQNHPQLLTINRAIAEATEESHMENDQDTYWVSYDSEAEEATQTLKSNVNEVGVKTLDDEIFAQYVGDDSVYAHANNVDTALYLTDQVYQEAVSAGYHCYAVSKNNSTSSSYPWADTFMDYLANGEKVSFGEIENDIYYLLDAGSTVVDYMGYDTYGTNTYYDFDFVDSADKLVLKVGDAEYKTTKVESGLANGETARYVFNYSYVDENGETVEVKATNKAEAPFVLHYYAGEGKSEHFVWDINVPVSQFETVQLTYTVKLTNPETDIGTYGEYDEDGIWKPNKQGLGMWHVLDELNKIYGDGFIKY